NYRFDDPDGSETDISGHNLGNLILTALTQQTGSFMEAVSEIQKVLNVRGKIIPATSQVITLLAEMEDGVVVKGEANIPTRANRISRVFYDQPVHAESEAIEAIRQADLIIYGIGSVYTSILPNVIIPEIQQELMKAKARKVYFCNAMTQPGETDGYCLEEHVAALRSHGVPVDAVITSTEIIPEDILVSYYRQGSTPVYIRDGQHDYEIIRRSLLIFKDGLIRHDPKQIQAVISDLVKEL
ncbi:MAG: uridine diphosphate-N-acetylglucosamine-binding protein YvcK, partial [Bulleidia sp.]|nr:uridine diphosphate-N-acetylglucosamine-binding protein YvcK [Bulleidia sp.]